MDRSIIAVPPDGRQADFGPDFGQRSLLTVDTEEEFDWDAPFTRDRHSLNHVPDIAHFQQFCEKRGVVPLYLVDWPIVQSPAAVEILGSAVRNGQAEVGIHLHPWVNPSFEEEVNARNSYAGNLPPQLEREKFLLLRDAIAEKFGSEPLIYRAGRYGAGAATADLLRETGILIDTSVRANFDYRADDGPNYANHPLSPYWMDSERRLLELPLTTVYWGLLRKQGRALNPILDRIPHGRGVFSRLNLLEKIALTPEGVSVEEALRGIDIAIDDGLPLLVMSFHSPSLAIGHTPYVRNQADREKFYEWLDRVYAYLANRKVLPTSVAQIVQAVGLR
ncbi:MAG: polysaccharide deacetylase family protein [Tsuneonella suprasediminis]|uniref:polysaccharide deacetylase family protein n=1 Tax=Tsuneonella flava TaxID=2055955 RepID=UPI001CC1F99F|nr:polysaccharide deacetylase family protein [Tsuneonella flava]UBS33123.1 polysaccharide deacetylase family protein [Altererythrobacter sp. N1]